MRLDFISTDKNRLLTAADIADILNITVKAVYGLRHRGTLPPAIKFGNHLRWRAADIDRWLLAHLDDEGAR